MVKGMGAIVVIEPPTQHVYTKIKYKNSQSTIEDVIKTLESSARIAVADCSCRKCEIKSDACLILDEALDRGTVMGRMREISLDEAIEKATRTRDMGLGFMKYTQVDYQHPHGASYICISCHCCHSARERAGEDKPGWVGCDPRECWKKNFEQVHPMKCGDCRIFS